MKTPSDASDFSASEAHFPADRTGEKPLVSIVIPCFNNEAYVAEAIDSALGQTYENIEVIVIDDGSTDASLDIIGSYADRITWRTGPNQGACAARNKGLALATGEYVKFLDADDILTIQCVELQVKQFGKYCDSFDVMVGDHMIIDGCGNHTGTRQYICGVKPGHQFTFEHLFTHGPLTSEPLHRTDVIQSLGGFRNDVNRGQEHELHLRLFAEGVKFWYEPTLCYYYRSHFLGSRISMAAREKSHFNRPDALFELVAMLERRLGQHINQTRQLIAHRAWRHARDLLRGGHVDQADELFRAARQICAEDPVVGSNSYKLICALLGPRLAEEIGSVMRPLRGAK